MESRRDDAFLSRRKAEPYRVSDLSDPPSRSRVLEMSESAEILERFRERFIHVEWIFVGQDRPRSAKIFRLSSYERGSHPRLGNKFRLVGPWNAVNAALMHQYNGRIGKSLVTADGRAYEGRRFVA